MSSLGIALAAGAKVIVLLYAIPALFALFIALLGLMFRQMLLLALVLMAPLAILAWIFPGNDKFWKLWRGSFTKLLLLYPLIMVLIGGGRVFAQIIHDAGGKGFLETILILTAYIGPYFFIPATFKLAGGFFATVTGMANDRSRGIFDRAKKMRQQQYGQKGKDILGGNYYKGNNALAKFGSRALQTAALSPAMGFTGIVDKNKRRSRMATARDNNDFDAATQFLETAEAKAMSGDDDKVWATKGRNEQEVEKILLERAPDRFTNPTDRANAVADVMRWKRAAGERVGAIAATRAQAGTGTGYNYRKDGINDDMMTDIISVAGDNRGLSGRMLADMRPRLLQSGRTDVAGGGFARSAMIMDDLRTSIVTGGFAPERDADGGLVRDAAGNVVMRRYNAAEARKDVHKDVLQSNAGAAVAGKKEGVKQLVPVMKENVDAALASGEADKAAREIAKLAGKYDASAAIAPQNAEVLAEELLAQPIPVGSLTDEIREMLQPAITYRDPKSGEVASRTSITYQQAIEALRGNPDFQTMRREYQTAGMAAAVQAAQQEPGAQPTPIQKIPGT